MGTSKHLPGAVLVIIPAGANIGATLHALAEHIETTPMASDIEGTFTITGSELVEALNSAVAVRPTDILETELQWAQTLLAGIYSGRMKKSDHTAMSANIATGAITAGELERLLDLPTPVRNILIKKGYTWLDNTVLLHNYRRFIS